MTNLTSNTQELYTILQLSAPFILVIITIFYVILTKKILNVTRRQTTESMRNSLNTNKIELMKLLWGTKTSAWTKEKIVEEINDEIMKINEQLQSLKEEDEIMKREAMWDNIWSFSC